MKKYIGILFVNLFIVPNIFPQSVSKDGFINYAIGNKWKYESRFTDKELTIEINECTETDTLTTCQVENFGKLIIQKDSVFITDFFSDAGASGNIGVIKYYLANHSIDSVWNACWNCYGYGSEAAIFDTTHYDVFGEKILVKHVGIKEYLGEKDSLGNPVVQLEIAEKFGIVSIQYYEGDALVLTGAVIEGEAYGELVVSNEQEEEAGRVQSFSLSEPYPNPFNPDVSIELSIARLEEIKIQVFDILGRLVLAIPAKKYSTGTHRVHLDLEELQTGLFYIVVQSSSQSATQKITKVK